MLRNSCDPLLARGLVRRRSSCPADTTRRRPADARQRLLRRGGGDTGDVVDIEQHLEGVHHRRLVVDDQDLEAPLAMTAF